MRQNNYDKLSTKEICEIFFFFLFFLLFIKSEAKVNVGTRKLLRDDKTDRNHKEEHTFLL